MERIAESISSVALPLVVMLVLPNLGKLRLYFSTRNSLTPRPVTLYDRLAASLLITAMFFYAFRIFSNFDNVFSIINCEVNAQSFHLKRQCERYPIYHDLCSQLIGNHARNIYRIHGNSLMNCNWCKETQDYFLYSLPTILREYFVFLTVVASASANWRREVL